MAMTQTVWHVPDDAHYRSPAFGPGHRPTCSFLSCPLRGADAKPPAIVEGSVVRLKTGGPKMTVAEVQGDGIAHLVWFEGSDENGWGALTDRRIPVGALVAVDA